MSGFHPRGESSEEKRKQTEQTKMHGGYVVKCLPFGILRMIVHDADFPLESFAVYLQDFSDSDLPFNVKGSVGSGDIVTEPSPPVDVATVTPV